MTPFSATLTDSSPLCLGESTRCIWAERTLLRALRRMTRGHLRLELPDGRVHEFGVRAAVGERLPKAIPAHAVIRVHQWRVLRRCLAFGDIGFAESYIDGDWSTPDLTALLAWFVQNADTAPTFAGSRYRSGLSLNLFRFANRLRHRLRRNSRRQAERNIHAHYDLSNAFFSLFLDRTMMYSAGWWEHDHYTLEEAQHAKNDRLCRLLKLGPTDSVLEIGTGWGGWALHAARHYGCHVTTVTLSQEQATLARRRVREAGLEARVDVRYQDFRDVQGAYDKLVSIEMMEALGHEYQPVFCQAVDRLLKPQGLAALQFITCPDPRYAQLRRGVDFIQKHIFPGSLLISLGRINRLFARHGGWQLHDLHDLGMDYARTLAHWQTTFQAEESAVRELGFDTAFIRKWNYYLSYCRAAFALRHISVVQALYSRPNNLAL